MKPFFLALSTLTAGVLAAQTPQTNLQNANPQMPAAQALPVNIQALMPQINYPATNISYTNPVFTNINVADNNDAYVSLSNVSNVSLTNASYVQAARGNINAPKQQFSTVAPINAFDNNVGLDNNYEPVAINETNKNVQQSNNDQQMVQQQAKSPGKTFSMPSLSSRSRGAAAADAPAARASSSHSSAHHSHRARPHSAKAQRFFAKMKGSGHYSVSECFHF